MTGHEVGRHKATAYCWPEDHSRVWTLLLGGSKPITVRTVMAGP
jgi:hypothetical protein